MSIPMTQTNNEPAATWDFPDKWFLSAFCTWVPQNPEFADAPIRQVICNRLGVHEFVLLSCELASTATRPATTLWLRIERRPSQGGVSVLLNKAKPAEDTVRISTTPETLREPCGSQGFFTYSSTERPLQVLKLRHIAEMYQYFIQHSAKYSILGANCRWLCFTLFECLRGCQKCYGGHWIGARPERPTADVQTALEVKDIYLKEKHTTCCGSFLQSYSAIGIVASGIIPGMASSFAGSSLNNTPRNSQAFTESSVIYATAPPTPGIQPGVLPAPIDGGLSHSLPGHSHQHVLQPNSDHVHAGHLTPQPTSMAAPTTGGSCHSCQVPNRGRGHFRDSVPGYHPMPQPNGGHCRNSVCSSEYCLSRSSFITSQLGRTHEVTSGPPVNPGLVNLRDYTFSNSNHGRQGTTESSHWGCGSCGSPPPSASNMTTSPRDSIHSSHIHQAYSHVHDIAPSGSAYQYGSGDLTQHHTVHAPRFAPTCLHRISESTNTTQDNHHTRWHSSNRAPLPPRLNNGEYPTCSCPGCLGSPPTPAVHSLPTDYGHYQRPRQDLGHAYFGVEQGFPPAAPSAHTVQRSRPQPPRNWTQEMWRKHGEEGPLRTDSPPPMEGSMSYNNTEQPQQSPTGVKMPDEGDYIR